MAPIALSHLVLDRPGEQARLLVLVHGYGEPAADLTERLGLIDPDARFRVVVPDAPFEWRGKAIWHRAMHAREEAEQQYLASVEALDELLGELEREVGLAAADAVVGGFSQGGGLALGLLLSADVRNRPAAGFGVCSFPPMVRGFRVDLAAAAGRPYFLSSARRDSFASIELSRAGGALLRESGLDLTYVESEGEHEMTDTAARQIGEWLAHLGEPAGTTAPGDDLLDGVDGRAAYGDIWVQVPPGS
ncbi:MAG: hypothetical protein U0Q22_08255 [Acidimicrobiales bacterium]